MSGAARLTNYFRDAFVAGVMNDVPMEDFDAQQLKLLKEIVLGSLPDEVRKLYDDPKTRNWIEQGPVYSVDRAKNAWLPRPSNSDWTFNFSPSQVEKFRELRAAEEAQREKRRALQGKLSSVARSCTTMGSLRKALPEFVQYMPKDTAAPMDRTLPVIANLVSDLIAAGWPKDKAPSPPLAVAEKKRPQRRKEAAS